MVARIAPRRQGLTGAVRPDRSALDLSRTFVEHVTVRALMVKTIKENSEIDGFNFTQVKPMTLPGGHPRPPGHASTSLTTPLPHLTLARLSHLLLRQPPHRIQLFF